MKLIKSKKSVALLAVLAVAVIAAVGAYAYFTTTGAGTGSATVGHDTALVLHGTAPTTLYPGTASVVNFTADNPSSGHELLNTIHLVSVDACATAWTYPGGVPTCSGGAIATCGGTNLATHDFSMPDVVANEDVPAGSGYIVTHTGTLTMNNLSAPQDTCKNAFLNLNLTSN